MLTLEALFFKKATVTTELKPHQQRVVDRLQDPAQPGLVAVHGLGSGKTLTSIAAADALGMPTDVVTPAALQGNYQKELDTHTDGPPEMDMHTLEGVARSQGAGLKKPMLVVDEAHRIRNGGKGRTGLEASPAKKRLALTASLLFNNPADISVPINFVANKRVLPEDPDLFAMKYLRDEPDPRGLWDRVRGAPATYTTRLSPNGVRDISQAFKKYVDFHPGSTEQFPTREDEVIRTPMTSQQLRLYDRILEDMPPGLRRKVLMNLPPSKAESKQLNAFMSGARQVSNTTAAFDTRVPPSQPKIDRAAEELKKVLDSNPRAKAVIYSNYLESGLLPYQRKLDEMKIPYGSFTGGMSASARDAMVKDYNNDKLRTLFLSSAGGEGLDLKGTRLMQILEPHWNQEKLKQVAGRGIRYRSHAHLPESERNVRVQRFLATRTPSSVFERLGFRKPGLAADEYLDEMSQRKERLNDQVRALLESEEG